MTNEAVLIGLRAVVALSELEKSDEYAHLKESVAALNAKVRGDLPRKEDGTDWTEDDVKARAEQLGAKLDQLDEQRAGDATGHP